MDVIRGWGVGITHEFSEDPRVVLLYHDEIMKAWCNASDELFHWLSVLLFDTLMERFLEGRGGVEPCETSKHFLSIVGSSVKLLLNSAFSNFVIHLQTFAFAPNTILAVDVCLCLWCGLFHCFLLSGLPFSTVRYQLNIWSFFGYKIGC